VVLLVLLRLKQTEKNCQQGIFLKHNTNRFIRFYSLRPSAKLFIHMRKERRLCAFFSVSTNSKKSAAR
jgi:hypothetical protein